MPNFPTMIRNLGIVSIFASSLLLSSCGLVKVPFRVAGVVAEGVYSTGKGAVDASTDAFEKRRATKELEKAENEKKAAKENEKASTPQEPSILPPPDAIPPQEGPIFPVDGQLPPVEPLPLPE
jgi:hypothetical protein